MAAADPALVVRPAAAEDFGAVAALLAELGRPTVSGENVRMAGAVYRRHVERADTASLVAELGGRVVGFMSLEFRERLNCTRPQAWIPDLIVAESARGRGVGKALLLRGFAIARDHGCYNVTLESAYSRAIAHQLYDGAGMTNMGYFYYLPLD